MDIEKLIENTKNLAEAIIRLLSDSSHRKIMGEKARTVVEQKYSYKNIAKDYDSLFESLLSGKHVSD